jgi:hypothetical protein
MEPLLDALIQKYGSDKSMSKYTPMYSAAFTPMREAVTSVLEIGIGSIDRTFKHNMYGNLRNYPDYLPGGSLCAWRDFFPKATIYGVDIDPKCHLEKERIVTYIFDSSDTAECNKQLYSKTFDIIIDDGDHTPSSQIQTAHNLFSLVRFLGYYVIEDLGEWTRDHTVEENISALSSILTQHEYYHHHGGILFIRKNYSKKQCLASNEFFERSEYIYPINYV